MKTALNIILSAMFLIVSIQRLTAQPLPHPNNGAAPTAVSGNKPVGGGVTLADGSFVLLTLALAYTGRKWHEVHKKKAGSLV